MTQSSLARPPVTPVAASLDTFRSAARVMPTDPRVVERIAEVQSLVGDELEWVEFRLAEICAQGTKPATNAAKHLVERGGKRVRPLTTLLSAGCFGPVPASARTLAMVAELVHSATLLHDDVADEGTERRGIRTARLVYGNAVSVLAGDLLLVHALERTLVEVPDALPDLLCTLRLLVDGEVIQLRGRTELDVRESTYDQVLRGKTASLFAWAARAGARSSHASPDDVERMGVFGEQLGIAFQLVDDILDYEGGTGKTSLADLREGKLTLPLVLAVAAQPDLLPLVRSIHAGDLEPVQYLSRKVLASGACDIVRERAGAVTELAIGTLRPIASSPAKDLLVDVARELTSRVG
ncbi:MAG TPA: polyprenyl synthetase family protein [Polyangiaceae bacterium]